MATEKWLIDADALRKSMFSYYDCVNEHTGKSNYRGDTLMDYEVADLIDNCIDNAPTIDPVSLRKKGEWKPHYINNCGIKKQRGYNATCCGRWSDVKTRSCPNCGADMRGESK